MKQKRTLVTGGSGFIGASLVRRLVREGQRVRVLDNLSRGKAHRLKGLEAKIDFIRADVRDREAVLKACRGMDRVCHLAFINGTEFFYSKPELVLEVGVKGMMNVLDGCLRHGVKEFFLASSSEVYQTPPRIPTDESVPLIVPDPWNPRYSYGGAKIISELLALNYGRKYFKRMVIFRPHNVFGPDMGDEHVIPQFIRRMSRMRAEKEAAFPIQGTGRETRAFIYIEDFTEALWRILQRGKHLGIYHIGSASEIPIRHVAGQVAVILKKRIRIRPGKPASGGTARRCPDIQKILALGFRPRYSFREGLEKTAKWYLEHPAKKNR